MVSSKVSGLFFFGRDMHDFSVLDAKSSLVELLNAFQSPANLPRLEAARLEAGNDMIKTMQLVFPVVTQIQVYCI